MKRYFITHILPESLIIRHHLSTAACNFSFNLIGGNCFDYVYSLMGVNIFGPIESEAFEDNRFHLIYHYRLRSLGRLGRLFAILIEQLELFRKIEDNSSVWLYNATTLNSFLYLLLRILKKSVQVNVIELDFTPVEKGVGLNQLYLKIINNCHGNIRLAVSPLFTNTNFAILPGVVPATAGREPLISHLNNSFLLSGILNEVIAQTSKVLEAFSKLQNCELHITGIIEDDEIIKKYANKYPNIIWHGQVAFEEYLEIMHSCTYQLSTRDVNYPENQCNFPSKIIEALLHNRIVVSTIFYEQLNGLKFFTVGSETNDLIMSIFEITSLPPNELLSFANQGKIVKDMFSTEVWKKTMSIIEEK